MSGPVSAPYWGVLPVPKSRRASSDNYSPVDSHRDSPDLASQPLPRSNRASSQTVRTDAPTESTFSPLTSPTASSFRASGLAPPPPSQPYDQSPDEPSERRYRRTARFHEDLSEDPARATPPAAPDVPRAPPLSFSPYGNGRDSPYTFTASGQPGPPPSAHRSMAQARAADLGRSQQYQDDDDDDDELAARRAARAARNGNAPGDFGRTKSERRAENAPRPVRMPFDDPSPSGRRGGQRSSTWAADRSPLQKLELTLGSITKEEKRARVEAAEQRAREKAALAAQHAQEGSPTYPNRKAVQQGRARDPRPPVGQDARQRRDPPGAAPSPATRDQASQFPPEVPGLYASSTQTLPPPLSVTKNRDVAEPQKFDMPQRNLSFRDRTSQDTQDARRSEEASPTKPKRTISLTRNGSNKLKKNPPGDPWYGQRTEAERKVTETGHAGKAPAGHAPVARNASQKRPLASQDTASRPPVRGNNEYDDERDLDDAYAVMQGMQAAPTGLGRSAFLGANGRQYASGDSPMVPKPVKTVTFPDDDPSFSAVGDDESDAESEAYRHLHRDNFQPGRGMYQEPIYLDEWRKGTVGTLAGALLDIAAEVPAPPESSDSPGRRRSSLTSKARKGEAFDGEYDETQAPTRFKPPLYLECGPLLRYCGLRQEKVPARNHNSNVVDREIWRGSAMIVTRDSESSYEIVPILRLFVQPMDLLPPPPAELRGGQSLSPEYVDPIAGLPKLGRRGDTQYVRPVEHLEEAKDASMLEPDDGLFEITRSAPDFSSSGPEPRDSFTSRRKRVQVDGERLGKYKDVRGFRLHTERGCTFWRFNIEVELRARQQRIAYRINRGPSMGFWVPARGQAMNIMFHSCNGFSRSVNPDDLSGPDPMWRDVLNNHQTRPFHVMVGGGDQIYNDAVMDSTKHFHDWLEIKNPLHKNNAPFTARMQNELETFYLERYCMWFSQGLFGLANSQIPMVNMYDDHDIIDGFGSYPHHFMKTPVFSGLGNVAFKYYMLFQHQSLPVETEQAEPSWVLGCKPGPYIQQHSRSLYMSMGGGTALLAVDARTERTLDEVVREDTWKKIIDRCYAEINKGQTRHLLVLLGVPIAYPRLVWLENILTSRLMDPVKALGKAGLLGNFLNKFDGGVEVLDDLDDHWTSKNHKEERKFVVEDLQDLAADKSVRITILSGDVHLAAVGQFYSNPKLHIPKHRDFRYMPNVVSSAIVNTPPPDLMADVLNKRNKVHHFDKETDEDMIPLFTTGVDGKPRNNKRLLPHRNWCAIREYEPGSTPPPTPPPPEDYDQSPEGSPPPPGNKGGGGGGGGLLRRLSLSKTRGPAYRPDMPEEKDRSRPPVTGGLLRRLSRRASTSDPDKRPNKLKRSLSLGGRGDGGAGPKGGLFGRRPSVSSSQAGGGGMGTEGQYYSEDNLYGAAAPPPSIQMQRRVPPDAFDQTAYYDNMGRLGLRGGGSGGPQSEFEAGDDAYFTARPPHRAYTQPATATTTNYNHPHARDYGAADAVATPPTPGPRPFHRTPTGLSAKQLRKNPERYYEVDLEGGLEVTLNVEVNARDPAGITVPYRLLVPKLVYEYQGEDAPSERSDRGDNDDDENPDDDYVDEDAGIERPPLSGGGGGGGIRRWFSGRRSSSQYRDQWDGGDDTQYPPGHERGF